MGTSRVGFYNMDDLAQYVPSPIKNIFLTGSNIYEQSMYLKYAINNKMPKYIIWSLDFFAFNPDKRNHPDFSITRLEKEFFLNDYIFSLFGFQTFKYSLMILSNTFLDSNEKLIHSNTPSNSYKEIIQKNITHSLLEYKSSFSFLKSNTFTNKLSIEKNLEYIEEIITLAKKNNIQIFFYFSPVYIQHIELYKEMNLTTTLEYLKQRISYLTAYYDFCQKSSLSTNILNFIDSSHSNKKVGKIIFDTMFSQQKKESPNTYIKKKVD